METPIGQPPVLAWRADGVPEAPAFGDAYFGSAHALHEIAHVFLNGTELWQSLVEGPADVPLQIGETGFGTGLNFCAAVQLWLACKQAGVDVPPLHFTSIEAWPLAKADLAKALNPFRSTVPIADELLAAWPDNFAVGQLFTANFFDGQVQLALKIDDALHALQNITVPGGVDIWFLDGFAPDQNPDMWRAEVMWELGRLSAPKARLATFTAAGHVRRALKEAGFEVNRVKGHGRKRHMTVATYTKSKSRPKAPKVPKGRSAQGAHIAIIGGGLAGHVLVERAHHYLPDAKITLFDPDFSGSSTPLLASVVPRLDMGNTSHHWLMPRVFHFAADYWASLAALGGDKCVYQQIGARFLSDDPAALERARMAAPQMGGVIEEDGSAFWPSAGVVERDAMFAAIQNLAHPTCERAKIVNPLDLTDAFDHIILAAGAGLAAYLPVQAFPVTGRAGVLHAFALSEVPTSILHGAGHVLPWRDKRVWTGANFDHWELAGAAPQPNDFPREEEAARTRIKKLTGRDPEDKAAQWAGLRVVTPDQLPLAGPLPDWAQLAEPLMGLRHGQWLDEGALQAAFQNSQFHLLGGLGARGFLWAPLMADRVIRGLMGLTLDGGEGVAQALAPWRFLLREVRYGRLTATEGLPKGPVLASFA